MSLDSAIKDGLISLGLRHTETFISNLETYLVLLSRWNRITNLSGIKRLTDMVSVHLMDSLSVHAYLEGKTILDVGSGAGLPGIPLAILYPKKFFTLLDSNGKKTRFMRQAVIDLKLDNVQIIQERVEVFQGEFDHVISRAFSSLKNFLDSSERLVIPGGTLLAMKGDKMEQLNNKKISVYPLSVPELKSPRHLYVIQKPARLI